MKKKSELIIIAALAICIFTCIIYCIAFASEQTRMALRQTEKKLRFIERIIFTEYKTEVKKFFNLIKK